MKNKKPKVHTIVLLPGGVTIEVPGCQVMSEETPAGARLLRLSEKGMVLMVVPREAVIITNWAKLNHE